MTRQVENFNACPERPQTNTDNLCKEIYTPENKNQFCGPKPPETRCNSDDDFNSYLSDNLSQNIYEGGCIRPGDNRYQKNIDKGQKYLDKATTDLDQALSALDNGNTRGAIKQIEEALKRSGKSVDQFGAAVEKHKGGGINGGYGEDAIKDGSKEIKGSREEMKDALQLLKCGKVGEAYEAIRAAKDGLKSGGQEVQVGEDTLKGKKPVNTARGREAASDREFKEGAREFDRTGDALEDALNSLDHGDPRSAMRDLERSQRNLDQGQNNYKDGLRLNQTGDESGIKKGLETSKTVEQSIDAAMELVKCGCTREAKQMIEEAMKRLEKSSDQLARGVDRQDDNDCDFRPGDRPSDPRNDDRSCDRGRDIDFPRDYRPSNPNWRDRLNPGNGDNDRIGLLPGEFGFRLPTPPLPGRDFNPFDPIGLFDKKGGGSNFNPFDPIGLFDKGGGSNFNPLDPAGLFDKGADGGFNPLDPIGLFDRGKDGGFNPLDPIGLFEKGPVEALNPLNVVEKITNPIKKIFKKLF
ncbi:MAG: hypothetical protein IT342_22765 [Candidatus Melainabacteria bacterium]|nr:hypothetical protein [Candidatus Melainabacteria bacterium]